MNFIDLAKNRYATKNYDSSKIISGENIQALQEILRLSPSSINSQPWKFIFISNPKIKRKLANFSYHNKEKIEQSSHLIVFCVIDDIKKFESRLLNSLPENAINYYNSFLKPLSEKEIKTWLQNQVYLSLGFCLSACASLNIDSTPLEGIMKDEYDKILQIESYNSLFAVAIGYRNPTDFNQPLIKSKSRLKLDEIIVTL